ncbi:TonB-dependent siderophore receptor [Bradyrhizobium sp. RDI18]|uniref:TonB-dependent siderophore receptor n=1 Tax=Bradyrhizobium sp. RDI18 TaxID=3367400 RepID=UPI00371D22B4
MNNRFWYGASCAALLCVYGVWAADNQALAQSGSPRAASSDLPPVTVEAPRERAAARRAAVRSSSPRGVAPRARVVEAPPAPAISTAASPGQARGYVATVAGTGTKSDTPIVQIPQSINVVTADQIRDQGAQSVSQALGYTPGVSVNNFGALSPTDAYTRIRGFRADQYLDGTRLPIRGDGAASYAIEPYGLERIEVLKGPASGLYGSSGPGGIINMVSKRPTPVPFAEIQLQTGSYNRAQLGFDAGGPITSDKQFLYRLTGLVRDADTQVRYAEDNRRFIAPALTWQPTNQTSLTFLGHYSEEKSNWPFFNLVPPGGSLLPNPFGQIPRSTNTGEPGYDRLDRSQYGVGYAFEHRFNNDLIVRQNLRYGEVKSQVDAVANVFGFFFTNDSRTTTRVPINVYDSADALTVDNQVLAKFNTGFLSHSVVAGLDYRDEDSRRIFKQGGPSFLDIYAPVYGQFIPAPSVVAENSATKEQQLGLYLQDQIRLGSWLLSLGGRADWVDSRVSNFNNSLTVNQNEFATTGRVGVSYLFDNGVVPYVSYATSFQPVPGLSAAGTPFTPSTGEQYEVGVKYQPVGTNSLYTLALFDLTQQNVLTSDIFGFRRQTGEINVRGVEFEAKAELTRSFSLIASYAYLDAKITSSLRPAEIGRRPAETPTHQAAFWSQYQFLEGQLNGLKLAAGVRYVGDTEDDSHTLRIPAYALLDARIAYDFGALRPDFRGASFALSMFNLTDKYYVTGCFGANATACALGQGRKVLATLAYRWGS